MEVEYNEYPPPFVLIKIMKRCWANEFIQHGRMRFGSLESFKKLESETLRDELEGCGKVVNQGVSCTVGSINDIYAWCSSKDCIADARIMELAKSAGYNCFVCIHNPKALIQRVQNELAKHKCTPRLLHCGAVIYNRGSASGKPKFHFNIFQKHPKFSADCEYRLALIDVNMCSECLDKIVLDVGNCSDIAHIECLPLQWSVCKAYALAKKALRNLYPTV